MGFVCGRVTRIVTDGARIFRAGCARDCVVVAGECCVSSSKLCKAVSCLITSAGRRNLVKVAIFNPNSTTKLVKIAERPPQAAGEKW